MTTDKSVPMRSPWKSWEAFKRWKLIQDAARKALGMKPPGKIRLKSVNDIDELERQFRVWKG